MQSYGRRKPEFMRTALLKNKKQAGFALVTMANPAVTQMKKVRAQ